MRLESQSPAESGNGLFAGLFHKRPIRIKIFPFTRKRHYIMSFQNLVLTKGQAEAFDTIQQFLADDERKSCVLDGPAGSGKTTLLRQLMESLPDRCVICAPTNKAVSVLRSKGFAKATTLDRVLNKTLCAMTQRQPTANEILFYKENDLVIPAQIEVEEYEKIDAEAGGLVVCLDESSMTNEAEFTRLLNAYPKVIAVGDGFQLPPVEGAKWFQTTDPDIRLTEIVRTGAGSEITTLANLIRRKSPEWNKNAWTQEVTILKRSDVMAVEQAMKDADIVLAHKNTTCDDKNLVIRMMRNLIGADCYAPMPGDILLAWDTIKTPNILKSETYKVEKSFALPGGYRVLFENQSQFVPVSKANLIEQKTDIAVAKLNRFSFAHCITAHKSQGSEWDHVVVLAYDHYFKFDDHWNWLYTACTRAKLHLTIVI